MDSPQENAIKEKFRKILQEEAAKQSPPNQDKQLFIRIMEARMAMIQVILNSPSAIVITKKETVACVMPSDIPEIMPGLRTLIEKLKEQFKAEYQKVLDS